MIILIYDTETTGLPPKMKTKTLHLTTDLLDIWPYIVQLSYILYDTEKCKKICENDWIIQLSQDIEIPVEASNIHGITTEISHNQGVNIQIALDEFIRDWKKADLVVAHNMSFDLDMIKTELVRVCNNKRNKIKFNSYYELVQNADNLYCTMQESIELCNLVTIDKYGRPYIKFPRLSELHETLFLTKPSNLHNAVNDVIVCLRCFYKLKFDKDILDYDDNLKQLAYTLNMC